MVGWHIMVEGSISNIGSSARVVVLNNLTFQSKACAGILISSGMEAIWQHQNENAAHDYTE